MTQGNEPLDTAQNITFRVWGAKDSTPFFVESHQGYALEEDKCQWFSSFKSSRKRLFLAEAAALPITAVLCRMPGKRRQLERRKSESEHV